MSPDGRSHSALYAYPNFITCWKLVWWNKFLRIWLTCGFPGCPSISEQLWLPLLQKQEWVLPHNKWNAAPIQHGSALLNEPVLSALLTLQVYTETERIGKQKKLKMFRTTEHHCPITHTHKHTSDREPYLLFFTNKHRLLLQMKQGNRFWSCPGVMLWIAGTWNQDC